ncbi:MAG TPA: choice-of-anchor tandem repeat GloVer-containing protein [Terriglobales bacterium]|nr:choice-of-anchor tandem repeat GloVer-containing protein [Terriglobales bacterium]
MRLRAALAIFTVTLLVTSGWAATEEALFSFNNKGGALPDASVIFDAAGNLYSTAAYGGSGSCTGGCGTVFELKPKAGGGWTQKVLHRFANTAKDGHYPYAGLVFDASGNLYGTTAFGGSGPCTGGCGTVFELTPKAGGGWTERVLHSFNGKDGRYAEAALILDASGNLYGTTPVGGAHGYGTVFELTQSAGGAWTAKVLHNFNGGYGSYGSLIFDTSGNLYGTTGGGGTYNYGTVFKLTPNANGHWTETVLHSFNGNDGLQPLAGLILKKGGLYGTTLSGGAYNGGTVFELTPKTGAGWTEKVLYSFCSSFFHSCPDGSGPQAALIFDATGNLFGTTASGGSTNCSEVGCGTVFELTPSAGGNWTEKVVYSFDATGTDGFIPVASLTIDTAGDLFGTTHDGGVGYGTVFEITP